MGMFDTLKQGGNMMQMAQQARKIQQELAAEQVVITKPTARGLLKIVLTGDQKVVEISYDGVRDMELEKALSEVIYQSQMVAAKKLQSMSGGLGGLMGGQ